ncbi:radical SAM protein [Candidatus Bathycorpusculum sp.]|uniref:B12-binding domain-containing radical SAM protein n=1 Tax=Candidatus Bathycorpusculum sp. TaxID=2994959 RepID=UPI0028287176|nr:B12-binding domain-containing radical SAM protein [Candidatus Termitimicrobium sp.]
MNKKILLFHPQTSHERNYKFFWIPYSLLSVAGSVKAENYEVIIRDNNLEKMSDHRSYLEKTLDGCVCVGISSMIGHQISDGLSFAKQVRETDKTIPIVWGGALPTLLPRITLKNEYVDFIVRGQGETGLLGLLKHLSKEQKNLPVNVGFKTSENVLIEGQLVKPENREKFPNYPLDLIDVERYIRNDPHISTRAINYVSSQGCPFGCGFCADTALYCMKWSAFSAERTASEITTLTRKHNVNGIKFFDSNFFVAQKRALLFAELISKEGITWGASAHPQNILALDDKGLRKLRLCGLKRLLVGTESAVQEELNMVGKGTKVEHIEKVANLLYKNDLIASLTFVVGYPSMPEKNIDQTIKFVERLASLYPQHEFKIHLYLPYPGTPLYKRALDNGFSPPNDIEGWGKLDYYQKVTPWVSNDVEKKIRTFNESYCPYVT